MTQATILWLVLMAAALVGIVAVAFRLARRRHQLIAQVATGVAVILIGGTAAFVVISVFVGLAFPWGLIL